MTSQLALTFQPRPYQINLIRALNSGIKRAVWCVHRRGGKDVTAFNWCIYQLLLNPGWTAFHILPTYSQAKKVIWDSSTNDGKRILDYIPRELIESKNGQQMQIRLTNGSLFQLIGSDNIDSLVGTNPKIIIFSEYAIQSPAAWEYLRPILDVNKGYALFISTPRGKNHFYDLMLMAKRNPEWFCEILSIKDTGVLSKEDIDKIRSEGVSEEHIQQEYYCSFNRGVEGSYYGKLIEKMRNENRICNVPYETRTNVNTAMDLGVSDSTCITYWQEVGGEVRIIDYDEWNGEGLSYLAKTLQNKPYVYGTHYLPHDGGTRSLEKARTPQDALYELGIKTTVLPRETEIQTGIENVRSMLSTVFIDQTKCKHLIKCLENYHKKYNEKTQAYSDSPLHDWCFTGDTKVLTRNGMYQIMDLPNKGEVLTLCGWKEYTNPRITNKNAPLVEVKFVDGFTVKCTREHLFLTTNGWKSAESLTPYTEIQSSLTSLPNISMVDYIEYGQMKHISREEERNFIEMFGKVHLVKSLKDVTSTIKTKIREIICFITWNVYQLKNIYQKLGTNLMQKKECPVMNVDVKQVNGIDRKKEDYGIKDMLKDQNHGQNGKGSLENVYFAVNNLIASSENLVINKNTVTQTVKPLIIESVRHLDYKDDVWCLTVPNIEHFSLSNGAIVHNCSHAADSVRMMALARIHYGRGLASLTPEKLNQIKARAGYGPKPTPIFKGPQQPFYGR